MQIEPMTSELKAPGTKRLKLKSDEPLSSFVYNFVLRCYIKGFKPAVGSKADIMYWKVRLALNHPLFIVTNFILLLPGGGHGHGHGHRMPG